MCTLNGFYNLPFRWLAFRTCFVFFNVKLEEDLKKSYYVASCYSYKLLLFVFFNSLPEKFPIKILHFFKPYAFKSILIEYRLSSIQLISEIMEIWDLRTELDWNSKSYFTQSRTHTVIIRSLKTKRLFNSHKQKHCQCDWVPCNIFKLFLFLLFFCQRRTSTRSQIAFQSVDSNRGVWLRWILEHLK